MSPSIFKEGHYKGHMTDLKKRNTYLKYFILNILFLLFLLSCRIKGDIFFISDVYTPELKTGFDLINEFRKQSENNSFEFNLNIIKSEQELLKLSSDAVISEKTKIVMTSFVYINFYHEKAAFNGRRIFIIGPLFDIEPKKIEITGNWKTIFVETGRQLTSLTSGNEVSFFYTDTVGSMFPEEEITTFITDGYSENGDTSLSVLKSPFTALDGSLPSSGSRLFVIMTRGIDQEIFNRISNINCNYFLIDYINVTDLMTFNRSPFLVSEIRYDYKASFRDILLYSNDLNEIKTIYGFSVEKK